MTIASHLPATARCASPVAQAPTVTQQGPATSDAATAHSATSFTITVAEPVLPGHYPGFPIFPGVCLLECVHRSVLATAPAAAEDLELATVESARFLSPVYPGEVITVDIDWLRGDGDSWTCKARVSSERGDAAKARLRYRTHRTEADR